MTKNNSILVTGSHGLVGSSFISNVFNYDTHIMGERIESPSRTLFCPEHSKLDISNKKAVKKFFEKNRPQIVINFAAHRNANTAEAQRGNENGSAWMTNVLGVDNISRECNFRGIYLIHISTDMVFSGTLNAKGPFEEDFEEEANQSTLSWYGWTKKTGELIVRKVKGSSIIRIANVTRPVYDPSLDYVGKILWLYNNHKLYPMFDNQITTLTYIPHITDTILTLVSKKVEGTYHVASTNLLTPFKIADYLLRKLGLDNKLLKSSNLDDYLKLDKNRYPKYGGLKTLKTQKKLGLKFTRWEEIVDQFEIYVRGLRL